MDDFAAPEPGLDSSAFDTTLQRRENASRSTWKRKTIGIGLACLAGGSVVAAALPAWLRANVSVAAVERGTAIDAVYASGTIEAANRVSVKARIAGPIARLSVREGDHVAEGDVLAQIEAPALGHDVLRGESEVEAARGRATPKISVLRASRRVLQAQLAQAQLELQRAESGAKIGMSAAQDLERAKLEISLLEGQLATNRAQQAELQVTSRSDATRAETGLESLRALASAVHVRSPLRGVVLERYVEPGEVVAVNQDMFRVGDIERLQVEAIVDEADIARVHIGMSAIVRTVAFEERTMRARVDRISPAAVPGLRGFRVELALEDPVTGLRPGMSTECNIILEQHEGALLAPFDAAHVDHVWVVGPDEVVRRRVVEVGLRDLGRVELIQGVKVGERLVVGAEDTLADGQRVRAQRLERAEAGR